MMISLFSSVFEGIYQWDNGNKEYWTVYRNGANSKVHVIFRLVEVLT